MFAISHDSNNTIVQEYITINHGTSQYITTQYNINAMCGSNR